MKKKKTLSFITALVMIFTVLVAPQASADTNSPVVSQGDKVVIDNAQCTIGYVDKEKHKAYIASHCSAPNKENVAFNDKKEEIGVITSPFVSENMGIGKAREDVAYINLYNNVKVGENSFSGDNRVSPRDVHIGEELCIYSRRINKEVHCGKVKYVDGTLVVGDKDVKGIGGDSGGSAWIPGKGFVGVYTLIIGNDVNGHDHYFTTIDDADCTNNNYELNKNSDIDYSTMCPAGQYADHSPYIVEKVDLPSPHNVNKDESVATTTPEPEVTTTPKPNESSPGNKKVNVKKISSFGNSSTNGLGWLAGFAAITGVMVILSPIILSILNGKTPNFKI